MLWKVNHKVAKHWTGPRDYNLFPSPSHGPHDLFLLTAFLFPYAIQIFPLPHNMYMDLGFAPL